MMLRFSQSVALVSLFGVCLSLNITAPKCGGKQKVDTLLDVSRDFINRAKATYPKCVEDDFECGQKEKSLAFLDVSLNMINQVKKEYPVCPEPECPVTPEPERPVTPEPERTVTPEPERTVTPEPDQQAVDCAEVLRSGKTKSGVYSIWPRRKDISSREPLRVYCDMDTDGGGWTVIQRRGKFSTPKDFFYKDWAEYKKGFGNLSEEFWIGNDNIYAISNQANYSIRFDLKDHKGENGYAVYKKFRIEDENAQYKLHIDGFSGNVVLGDSMENFDNMKFSTKDRDNDKWSQSCAVIQQGAWWYNQCGGVNLNGLYQPGVDSLESVRWFSWKFNRIGLAWVEMKLKS